MKLRSIVVVLALLALVACAEPEAPDADGTWVGTITTEGNVTTVVNESGSLSIAVGAVRAGESAHRAVSTCVVVTIDVSAHHGGELLRAPGANGRTFPIRHALNVVLGGPAE